MNYCKKCQSDYEKPGTCNYSAPLGGTVTPLPYVPYQPYYPWTPAPTPQPVVPIFPTVTWQSSAVAADTRKYTIT